MVSSQSPLFSSGVVHLRFESASFFGSYPKTTIQKWIDSADKTHIMPRGGAHKAASIRNVATGSVSIQYAFLCMKIGVFLPYLDRAAYTVEMEGIRIAGRRLNISQIILRADSCGASQTMIDSSMEFVFLVEDAYIKVSEEVARLVGPTKLKSGFACTSAPDVCIDGDMVEIGQLVGEMVFEMECGVGWSSWKRSTCGSWSGVGSHARAWVIGNFYQQNMWLEFDALNRKVGFGKVECSNIIRNFDC